MISKIVFFGARLSIYKVLIIKLVNAENVIYFLIIIVHKNAFLSCAHVPDSRFSMFRCAHEAKKFVPDRQKLCILHKKSLVTNLLYEKIFFQIIQTRK